MKEEKNPNLDGFDLSEEYFKNRVETYETDEYFPQDTSKPPHY